MAGENFSNQFGSVDGQRVTYYRKKGWFSGGSRQDVPLRHVTSVRVEKTRHVVWGILLLLIGIPALAIGVGILFIALAVLPLWGSTTIVVNTAGGDLSVMKGFPWVEKDAQAFATALRAQLFKDEQ